MTDQVTGVPAGQDAHPLEEGGKAALHRSPDGVTGTLRQCPTCGKAILTEWPHHHVVTRRKPPCLLPDDDTAVERLAAALFKAGGPWLGRKNAEAVIAALREGGQRREVGE